MSNGTGTRGCNPTRVAAGTASWIALLIAGAATPASGQVVAELAPFEPYLDRTWKAVFDPETGAGDVVRWEPALAGRAVRITHSVRDGEYGGETLVTWDPAAGAFVYTYFTTAGFLTRGTLRFDEAGALHGRERVQGEADGITEVRTVQTLGDDGSLRVVTRMLRRGQWEDAGDVTYHPAPDAEVILPRTGG